MFREVGQSHSPYTPDINLCAILSRTQEELRRAIPPCHDTVCVPPSVGASVRGDGGVERSRETKVRNLQRTIVGDKQVGGFHVTM